jgi:hypothetical protein
MSVQADHRISRRHYRVLGEKGGKHQQKHKDTEKDLDQRKSD